MTGLDDRHLKLQREVRAWAEEARPHGAALDRDPTAIGPCAGLAMFERCARLQIPARYNPNPLVLAGERFHVTTSLERTVLAEEAAWGDLGLFLATPGASMAGLVVDVLGDEEQQERFYGRLLDRPTWTFFALTEPTGGSDATGLRARLDSTPDGFALSGAKRYVGNAVRGQLGVVFARTGPGPLGINAVLVDATASGFTAEPVPTAGLRGAQLGAIALDSVPIPSDGVLGRHLSPLRRGMWAWLRTFHVLRPAVAAMGVGLAQAAHDYVVANRRQLTPAERHRLDGLARRVHGVRLLARRAAAAVDRDPEDGRLGAAAKVRAARLARDAALAALDFFGPGAGLEHPFLEKLARDVRGIEFMEGTSDIQRLTLSKDVVQGRSTRRTGCGGTP